MFATVLLLFLGLLFTSLSALIWRFKWFGVLAGYDPDKVTNPNALAAWCGKCLLFMADMSFLSVAINAIWHSETSGLITILVFAFSSHISLVMMLTGVGRYTR